MASTPNIRGISYPLKIVNGNISTSINYDLKIQEIRSVIETRFFERVMRADYGVGDYTLSVMNPSQINSDFQNAIQSNVQGLSSVSVLGDWLTGGDDGVYKLYVTYSINGVPQPPLNFSLSN